MYFVQLLVNQLLEQRVGNESKAGQETILVMQISGLFVVALPWRDKWEMDS